jgi:hypothetical protein
LKRVEGPAGVSVELVAAGEVDPVVADSFAGCGRGEVDGLGAFDGFGAVAAFDGESDGPDVDRVGVEGLSVMVAAWGDMARRLPGFCQVRVCGGGIAHACGGET